MIPGLSLDCKVQMNQQSGCKKLEKSEQTEETPFQDYTALVTTLLQELAEPYKILDGDSKAEDPAEVELLAGWSLAGSPHSPLSQQPHKEWKLLGYKTHFI